MDSFQTAAHLWVQSSLSDQPSKDRQLRQIWSIVCSKLVTFVTANLYLLNVMKQKGVDHVHTQDYKHKRIGFSGGI